MTREPLAGFLNYPGNHEYLLGEVRGPNALGEMLTVVSAVYDRRIDKTRVGFTYATVDDVERSITPPTALLPSTAFRR
jgi:hypothetical protein